ncbi:hypothetical protein FC32_GL001315 [Ligilactobacillus apodemi DSM 16634 = JCM 16172]|uniref:Abi family protein n=1 Tax=Ligilactobacillus apodemi DSM 16634 = JCM 16172 TaxID=1423724 RepID=A0A0R1TRJ8_9LACO|nr:hypothetical protein FC32_GL001315 [Ligilactobacillus apodemi DSM 16634 = JCM 16172]
MCTRYPSIVFKHDWGVFSLKNIFDKPYAPVEHMIKKLKDKKLVITDENTVVKFLNDFGYNRLINGYKRPFVQKNIDNLEVFSAGVTIDDLYSLYVFDSQFREVFLANVLQIDSHLGTLLGNLVAQNYNVNSHKDNDPKNPCPQIPSYLSSKYYQNTRYARSTLDHIRKKILNSTKENPTAYYRNNKNHVPPWILVQNIPFGTLIRFYKIQKDIIKNTVVTSFLPCNINNVNELSNTKQLFLQATEILRNFRNTAAHSSPMYLKNVTLDNVISKKTLFKYLGKNIFPVGDSKKYLSDNKLYIALLSLILLAGDVGHRKFILSRLRELDDAYKESDDYRNNYLLYLEYANLPIDYVQRLTIASEHLYKLEKDGNNFILNESIHQMETVYTLKNSAVFHATCDCSRLKNRCNPPISLPEQEAISKGLRKCKNCF